MIATLCLTVLWTAPAEAELPSWPFVIRALEGKGVLGFPMQVSVLQHVGFQARILQGDEYVSVARVLLHTAETEWDSKVLAMIYTKVREEDEHLHSKLIRQALLAIRFREESLYVHSRFLPSDYAIKFQKVTPFAMVTVGDLRKYPEAKDVFLTKDGVVLGIERS